MRLDVYYVKMYYFEEILVVMQSFVRLDAACMLPKLASIFAPCDVTLIPHPPLVPVLARKEPQRIKKTGRPSLAARPLTRPMCPYAFYREEKQHHSPSQDPSSCRSWPENHASAEGLCGMDLRGEAQSCTSDREEVRGRRSLAGSKLGTSGCGGGACRLGAEHEQSRRRLGPEHERPRRGESDEAEGKQSGREKDQAEEGKVWTWLSARAEELVCDVAACSHISLYAVSRKS
jgi:hypothetical protein